MSAPPPNHENPSSRFTFEDSQRPRQKRKNRESYEGDTLTDQVLEEVDDALGCSNRLLGCSFWLFTLPFRLVSKVIQAIDG